MTKAAFDKIAAGLAEAHAIASGEELETVLFDIPVRIYDTGPRLVGTMRCYGDLVAIVRARIAELGITHQVADDLAGLQDGYTSKLLCTPPMRRMTPWSLFLIFAGLGLTAEILEDEKAMARIASRVAKGRSRAPKRRLGIRPGIKGTTPDLLSISGRKGGETRMSKLTPKQRAKLGRKAALARWGQRTPGPRRK